VLGLVGARGVNHSINETLSLSLSLSLCNKWKNGDVIGLACDLDAMRMHVSLNGSEAPVE
jgi:hypothetical protein